MNDITTDLYSIATIYGGSSGDEAAVIALYGSLLGVDCNISGSIRRLTDNYGLYGLKPSTI